MNLTREEKIEVLRKRITGSYNDGRGIEVVSLDKLSKFLYEMFFEQDSKDNKN